MKFLLPFLMLFSAPIFAQNLENYGSFCAKNNSTETCLSVYFDTESEDYILDYTPLETETCKSCPAEMRFVIKKDRDGNYTWKTEAVSITLEFNNDDLKGIYVTPFKSCCMPKRAFYTAKTAEE